MNIRQNKCGAMIISLINKMIAKFKIEKFNMNNFLWWKIKMRVILRKNNKKQLWKSLQKSRTKN